MDRQCLELDNHESCDIFRPIAPRPSKSSGKLRDPETNFGRRTIASCHDEEDRYIFSTTVDFERLAVASQLLDSWPPLQSLQKTRLNPTEKSRQKKRVRSLSAGLHLQVCGRRHVQCSKQVNYLISIRVSDKVVQKPTFFGTSTKLLCCLRYTALFSCPFRFCIVIVKDKPKEEALRQYPAQDGYNLKKKFDDPFVFYTRRLEDRHGTNSPRTVDTPSCKKKAAGKATAMIMTLTAKVCCSVGDSVPGDGPAGVAFLSVFKTRYNTNS